MSNESEVLFSDGTHKSTGNEGSKFGQNAPPAAELAAAIADLDLEAAISAREAVEKSMPRRPLAATPSGTPRVQFDEPRTTPTPTTAPRIEEKPRVLRGPVAIDPERIASLEKPSLVGRLLHLLFGWIRRR